MLFTSPFPDVAIPEVPLTQFLFAAAATRAEKPALIDGPTGRTLTYGQLVGAIRLVAASLAKRGLKKGDVFAIYSPNLPEYAVAFHAVASLGAINTTVNPLYTAHELAHQLKDAGARYLLTIPQFLPNALAAAQEVGGSRRSLSLARRKVRRRLGACSRAMGSCRRWRSTRRKTWWCCPIRAARRVSRRG